MAHELSNDSLVLTQAILEAVKKINKELSNIFLLINGYLLCMIINDTFKHIQWTLVLKIGEQHFSKQLLHLLYQLLGGFELDFIIIIHFSLVDWCHVSREVVRWLVIKNLLLDIG